MILNVSDIKEVRELQDELTANGKRIYLDYKDGKYGYNTDAERGADTFIPFNKPNAYTTLTSVEGVRSNTLGSYEGCGYITLQKISGTAAEEIHVYIDGNTLPFTINGVGVHQFYFTQSIRFTGGSTNMYYVQLLLSDKAESDYKIIQSVNVGATGLNYEGKGKIQISPIGDVTMFFVVDDGILNVQELKEGDYLSFTFHNKFSFLLSEELEMVQFILYLEQQ